MDVHFLSLYVGLKLGCIRSVKGHLPLLTLQAVLEDMDPLKLRGKLRAAALNVLSQATSTTVISAIERTS